MRRVSHHESAHCHDAVGQRTVQLVCVFAIVLVPLLVGSRPAAASPQGLIPVTGYCVFGDDKADTLTATFSPSLGDVAGSLSGISGDGSCTSNASSNTVSLSLSSSSTWACAGGAGFLSGGAGWSDANPQNENALSGAAAGGPASVHVWLHDSSLRFEAWGSFAWSPLGGTITACPVAGASSTDLVGVMYFAST